MPHKVADPDSVLATIDAALYLWRPPTGRQTEDRPRPASWLAALWTYHVDAEGKVVAKDPSETTGGDPALFVRSIPEELRDLWRRQGVREEDTPPIGEADREVRLLIAMLRAIALWNRGQAELKGDRLELVRPDEAWPGSRG